MLFFCFSFFTSFAFIFLHLHLFSRSLSFFFLSFFFRPVLLLRTSINPSPVISTAQPGTAQTVSRRLYSLRIGHAWSPLQATDVLAYLMRLTVSSCVLCIYQSMCASVCFLFSLSINCMCVWMCLACTSYNNFINVNEYNAYDQSSLQQM